METHDFTAAKVGDKVSHPIYGNGVIINIDRSKWPIDVKFNINIVVPFTLNGKAHDEDLISLLYHNHNTFQIIATPVSQYKDGEWIAVSYKGKIWYIEKFVKMGDDGIGVNTEDLMGSKDWNEYHKSLTELNSELNNL